MWSSSTISSSKPPIFLRIDLTFWQRLFFVVMKIVVIFHCQLVEWFQQSYHKFINCKGISALATHVALKMHNSLFLCLCVQLSPLLSLNSMLGVGHMAKHLFVHRKQVWGREVWDGSDLPMVWHICSRVLCERQWMANKSNKGKSVQHTTMRHDLTY